MSTWTISRERILTKPEILAVLAELKRKARRSPLTRRQLILFRLACCCGLRACELTRLRLSDVRLGTRPSIFVPKAITKADRNGKRRSRSVPLNWDYGTLEDLTAWKAERESQGAAPSDLLLCTRTGQPIHTDTARNTFQSCCRCLNRPVTIHDGRHSFISHALHEGRTVVQVRDAAGHANIATTSLYAHLVDDDSEQVGNLFG
jgi:integrase/recombinase XerD